MQEVEGETDRLVVLELPGSKVVEEGVIRRHPSQKSEEERKKGIGLKPGKWTGVPRCQTDECGCELADGPRATWALQLQWAPCSGGQVGWWVPRLRGRVGAC